MKKTYRNLPAVLLIGAFLSAPLAFGQVAVTESTSTTASTTSMGTISEFSPTTVVLKSETSPEPMRYTYSKSTTVVDEAGAPVDISIIKTGVPVQVIYAKDGDGMVARKIVVKKTVTTVAPVAPAPAVVEKRSTTTTTTESK